MARYNDLDPKYWKEYTDINTDSLWIIDKRDNSGVHSPDYHGNFVPQIPHQLFIRYTKKGDWILDPFMGGGTSLIEAQRMGRNSIGIELQPDIARNSETLINIEHNDNCITKVITGDSRCYNINSLMEQFNIPAFQFVIMHPPYWDIIKFSDKKEDLSNCATTEEFYDLFEKVAKNGYDLLEKGRFACLIIGDKYANSQHIPLGFECMARMNKLGFITKAIIIKDMQGNERAKGKTANLWRYRALAGGFYIFKHEYVMVFQKG